MYERARRITSTRRMEERRVRSAPRAMRRPEAAESGGVDGEEGEEVEEEGGEDLWSLIRRSIESLNVKEGTRVRGAREQAWEGMTTRERCTVEEMAPTPGSSR